METSFVEDYIASDTDGSDADEPKARPRCVELQTIFFSFAEFEDKGVPMHTDEIQDTATEREGIHALLHSSTVLSRKNGSQNHTIKRKKLYSIKQSTFHSDCLSQTYSNI